MFAEIYSIKSEVKVLLARREAKTRDQEQGMSRMKK